MSRIERRYSLISTSYLLGLFDIFILLHIWQKIVCVLVTFYQWGHLVMLIIRNSSWISLFFNPGHIFFVFVCFACKFDRTVWWSPSLWPWHKVCSHFFLLSVKAIPNGSVYGLIVSLPHGSILYPLVYIAFRPLNEGCNCIARNLSGRKLQNNGKVPSIL